MNTVYLTTLEKLRILFKSTWSLIAVLGFVIGIVLFLAGGAFNGLTDLQYVLREVVRTNGYITDIENTNITINEEPLERYYYSFPIDLETHYGESYTYKYHFELEERVPIEYIKANPEISRIVGTSNTKFDLAQIALAIILVALLLFLVRYFKFRFMLSIIQRGTKTDAYLESSRKTNISVNDAPLFKHTYLYKVNNEEFRTSVKNLNDEGDELIQVIYADFDHKKNITLGQLPRTIAAKFNK